MDNPYPRTAVRLQQRAPEMGWSVETLAGSGWWRNKPVDLVIVRLDRGTCSAVAQWVNGKAETCWVWPWSEPPGIHKLGYRELMTYLAENGTSVDHSDR